MALLTSQKITHLGVLVTRVAAASGGDSLTNDGRTYLDVANAHASVARTVTVNRLKKCDQGFDHDLVVSIPALSNRRIGPFRKDEFDDANGRVAWTYSSEADLTVAAVQMTEAGS